MPHINPKRLLDDLHTLRGFGACGTGVVRPSLSSIDMEARRWLCQRMREAGLNAVVDGVGNVIGRSPNPGPALLLGSHSDTQPRGGWLDGALGVVYALEVARALAEDPDCRSLAVDAVAWVDEEGTFTSCLGSRSFCGLIDAGEIDRASGPDGQPLREALRQAGLNGCPATPEPGRYRGYLEAHIEQGGYLEQDQMHIGVVTEIVGSHNYRVSFSGQQNHAGTTPMALRRDAGMALIEFAHGLNQALRAAAGPRTVWTVGRVVFDPGTASIIPGRAEMLLQFRDPQAERLDALAEVLQRQLDAANAAGPVTVSAEPSGAPILPTTMDAALAEGIAAAAERHAPGRWQRMPSAAIHDAMFVAERMPAAMLFVPSIGGISHDFAEDTAEADIVRGCRVLADAAALVLQSEAAS